MFGRLLVFLCLYSLMLAGGAAAAPGTQDSASAAPADTAEAPEEPVAAPDSAVAEPAPVRTLRSTEGTVIYGMATLSNGYPLAEVTATLFVGGLEEASAKTDTSGVYSMSHPIDRSADETVVLWFTPPRGMGLVREIVVLKESRAARETRQFNACMERVDLNDSTLVNIVVLNQQDYAQKLEDSGCMDLAMELATEYDFSYDLVAGDTFTITTSGSSNYTQRFGGEEMTVTSNSTSTFAAVVDSVGEDGIALDLEYTGREFNTNSPQARGSVDFSPLVGQKVSMTLSSMGELSRFAGFDALPAIEINPNETLDREAYVNEVRYLFPRLSGGPVAQGGTWTDEYSIRQSGDEGGFTTIDVRITYTLVGETVHNGLTCLEIDSESTVAVKGEGTRGGTPFTVEMSGGGSGKVYFDHGRGMLIEQTQTGRVEGEVASSVMTIPVVNETESKLEVSLQ